jgi:hypothetical protein
MNINIKSLTVGGESLREPFPVAKHFHVGAALLRIGNLHVPARPGGYPLH